MFITDELELKFKKKTKMSSSVKSIGVVPELIISMLGIDKITLKRTITSSATIFTFTHTYTNKILLVNLYQQTVVVRNWMAVLVKVLGLV